MLFSKVATGYGIFLFSTVDAASAAFAVVKKIPPFGRATMVRTIEGGGGFGVVFYDGASLAPAMVDRWAREKISEYSTATQLASS